MCSPTQNGRLRRTDKPAGGQKQRAPNGLPPGSEKLSFPPGGGEPPTRPCHVNAFFPIGRVSETLEKDFKRLQTGNWLFLVNVTVPTPRLLACAGPPTPSRSSPLPRPLERCLPPVWMPRRSTSAARAPTKPSSRQSRKINRTGQPRFACRRALSLVDVPDSEGRKRLQERIRTPTPKSRASGCCRSPAPAGRCRR
jgi:hypothetical protein